MPRTIASSSTKNSDTPAGGSSAHHPATRCPGSSGPRSADAGRSAANRATTTASYAANCARTSASVLSSPPNSGASNPPTSMISASRVRRRDSPGANGDSGAGTGERGLTATPTVNSALPNTTPG